MDSLKSLHLEGGVSLVDFVEKPFAWDLSANRKKGTVPYTKPWVGIIHNPPNMPEWFGSGNTSNQHIFAMKAWKKSLPSCQGLFTLSEYHRNYLQPLFNFPVVNLFHPTETPEIKFTLDAFHNNKQKKIIQVGWWLRKFESIHKLTSKLQRAVLHCGNPWFKYLKLSEKNFAKDSKVIQLPWKPNKSYDLLLSRNLVFVDLYDSSANNAIIECIVRNTPILVNPLDSVKEYLGDSYPFYFSTLEEAQNKAEDFQLIEEAHNYLRQLSKEKLTQECFLKSFAESEIYQKL
jgi:hypothetical protein